jgi:hypothetical protein
MKRLLLSFACLFAMVGTISKAEKMSTKAETDFHDLKCKLHKANTAEKAILLKELVGQCDCNHPEHIEEMLHYLKEWDKSDLSLFQSWLDDLSSKDFKAAKEIAAQKAPHSDTCLLIANHMLERQKDARSKEINIFGKLESLIKLSRTS